MNFLRSIFISSFVSWLFLLGAYALIQLSRGMEPKLAWLGLVLTALAPLAFFVKSFLYKTPRTPRHPLEYSIMSGIGLVITMAMSYRYGPALGWIHLWAGLTLIGWLVYLRWYSVFRKRDVKTLRVGAPLPVFDLQSTDGHAISSQGFVGSPHLLLFHRGNWCPFCTAQIRELAAAYQRLDNLGVKVVLISPQPAANNAKLASRFDVPMVFLRDPDNAAAKKLGIEHPWGTPMGLQLLGYGNDTVLPTVIASDAAGNIIYLDQTNNYRIRPEPDDFIAMFKQAIAQRP